MKKLFAAVLVVLFAVGLVGCEKSDEQKQKDQPQKGSMGKATPGKNW